MPDGCVEWSGWRDSKGYGRVKRGGISTGAHRLAWERERGPIPADLHVLHHCDNPPCVNVEHLFLGTEKDNAADRDMKGRNGYSKRTHCPQGHEYTPENTYQYGAKRACRECNLERSRIRHAEGRVRVYA